MNPFCHFLCWNMLEQNGFGKIRQTLISALTAGGRGTGRDSHGCERYTGIGMLVGIF